MRYAIICIHFYMMNIRERVYAAQTKTSFAEGKAYFLSNVHQMNFLLGAKFPTTGARREILHNAMNKQVNDALHMDLWHKYFQ